MNVMKQMSQVLLLLILIEQPQKSFLHRAICYIALIICFFLRGISGFKENTGYVFSIYTTDYDPVSLYCIVYS